MERTVPYLRTVPYRTAIPVGESYVCVSVIPLVFAKVSIATQKYRLKLIDVTVALQNEFV